MLRVFKIQNAGRSSPGSDLVGLLIVQADDGLYVVAPEPANAPPRILATSRLLNVAGTPKASFRFHYMNEHWTLDVDSASSFEMGGIWKTPPEQGEDSWTASGTGAACDTDEAAAASA